MTEEKDRSPHRYNKISSDEEGCRYEPEHNDIVTPPHTSITEDNQTTEYNDAVHPPRNQTNSIIFIDAVSLPLIERKNDHTNSVVHERSTLPNPLMTCTKNISGYLFVLLAGILFTLSSAIAKYLKHIPSEEIVYLSSVLSISLILPFSYFKGIYLFRLRRKKLLFFRILLASTAFIIKTWCVQRMNYGDVIALFFTAPLFAGIYNANK